MSVTQTRASWIGNADAGAIVAGLRTAQAPLILTHARPDGDAIGSTIALARSLTLMGKRPRLWYVGPMPRWATDLIRETPVQVLDSAAAAALAGGAGAQEAEPDVVLVVDTGAWVQIEDLAWVVRRNPAQTLIIDHHISGDADMATRRLIDPKAAAAAEIAAGVCVGLLGVGSAAKLPREVAEPLYTGLATDTGWFHFSNTRPATLRLAAELIEAGADFSRIFELIEQQDRPARLRLLGRALNSLELWGNDRAAMMTLTRRDFDECGGDAEDTGGFATHVLSVKGMQVVAVATEATMKEGKGALTKFSLRSKPGPGAIDVSAVCQKLGGGGHARAAGLKLPLPMAEAKGKLREALGL